jgi:hypothetical protein
MSLIVIGNAVEQASKLYIKKVVIPKMLAKAIAKIPFLGLKFVNPFFAYGLEKFVMFYSDEFIEWGMFKTIDAQAFFESKEYLEEVERLKRELSKDIRDEDEIEKARLEFEKRLRDLINIKP